jgi:hypothetical protein
MHRSERRQGRSIARLGGRGPTSSHQTGNSVPSTSQPRLLLLLLLLLLVVGTVG